jgi:hypothetical protein
MIVRQTRGCSTKLSTAVIDDLAWYARASPAQRIIVDCWCMLTREVYTKVFRVTILSITDDCKTD